MLLVPRHWSMLPVLQYHATYSTAIGCHWLPALADEPRAATSSVELPRCQHVSRFLLQFLAAPSHPPVPGGG